jgi:Protein of unknown function (DUF2924)
MDAHQSGRRAATPAAETLKAELDRIAALNLPELRSLWLKIRGRGAPRAMSSELLARAIAYQVQEQQLGKLNRELRRRLDGLARGGGEPIRHLKVGTVIVREYQDETHEVLVVPGGFCWKERTFPSLSAIALAITGTSWNGPRFFGLRGKSGSGAADEPIEAQIHMPKTSTRGAVRSGCRLAAAAPFGIAPAVEISRRNTKVPADSLR